MPKADYDPLTCIPSVDALTERIRREERLLRRLRILLRTARAIQQNATAATEAADRREVER